MHVITPIPASAYEIISTNVVNLRENWNPFSSYIAGDIVTYTDGIEYQSIQSQIGGGEETTVVPGTDPEYWIVHSVINPHKPFDGIVSNQASRDSFIEYELAISEVAGGLAFLNMSGATSIAVTVTADDGANETYNTVIDLLDQNTGLFLPEAVLLDLPTLYRYTTVNITISGVGEVLLGEIIFGKVRQLGPSEYNASSSIIDYSLKDADEFGTYTIEDRDFSRRLEARFSIPTSDLKATFNFLTSIKTEPVVWVTTDKRDYSSVLVVFGYYRDFEIGVPNCEVLTVSVSVEGLAEGSLKEGPNWDDQVWRYRRQSPEYWIAEVTAIGAHTVMWDNIKFLGGNPVTYGLVNPGAETVIVAPWVSEQGVWGQRNDQPKPALNSGSNYFSSIGSERCILSQETDVIAGGLSEYDIDTGQVIYTVEYLQSSIDTNYKGGVFLRFLDENRVYISESTPNLINVSSWAKQIHNARIPAGTRYVTIVLQAEVYAGNVAAYFDDINPTTIISPPPQTDSLGRLYFEVNGSRFTKSLKLQG